MTSTQAKDDAAVRDQATLHDTRQLLDELDALMDQMLALPIDDADNGVAPPIAPPGPAPTVSATLTLVEPAAASVISESPSASNETLRPTRFDVTSTKAAPATAPPQSSELSPALLLTDVAAPALVKLLPPPRPVPSARWRPDHVSYRFLLWVNQSYDRGTSWLGLPGRFLRSRAGKALLGFTGVGLLALALAWLAKDWLGWNS